MKTIVVAACCVGLLPATATAAITTFGSHLGSTATLNTSEGLSYAGVNTPLPGYVVYTSHFGADTALWNTQVAGGPAGAPEAGQVVKVNLEGCAKPAPNGPPPLTQIHFQVLSPQPEGSAKVELTSQPFDIPVCGQNGAGGSTVSTYEPVNLCVNTGDYVDFNDEGGFVEGAYRSGVPYQVMGSAPGSTMDSFIKGGGTDNGAVMSTSENAAMEGFASNHEEELMLQAVLGTGSDARYVCPGGTKEAPPASSREAVGVVPQSEFVDHTHTTSVAIYCRLSAGCTGIATLSSPDGRIQYGTAHFVIPGRKTSHVRIAVNHTALRALRKYHSRLTTTVAVVVGGQGQHQTVRLVSG